MSNAESGNFSPDAHAGFLDGYHPLPGTKDEMRGEDGAIRPIWRPFITALAALDPAERTARIERADQYLRDAGVFYRIYDDGTAAERDWPLSHVPVLIHETEWQRISAGLIQRAELLEAIVADIYGENSLVAEGILPPSLVAGNAEFLRPLHGVRPASGHFLHYCAFELGRSPTGDWWVLGDRTQAPSGAGFALENRVATTRAFGDIHAESHVHRLAAFFREFRDSLQGLSRDQNNRAAILSPGPHNDTYFEHAYIARYLGLMLVEGEDLVVVNGEVMVRTVSGLRPVDVIWRRLDAEFADPLELNTGSHIGTPGLVGALRNGAVSMVNALGSGILETRAMLAFMPALCRHLRGEDLMLPGIATWWCGQEAERNRVIADIDRMMIGPAMSTRLPFEDNQGTVLGGSLGRNALASIRDWVSTEGHKLVGQEAVTLSTTPALTQDGLVPRPMSLRAFAVRTANGWTVMPGGFARVGRTSDATAIAMQRGGSAADVWIVSDTPVEQVSLLDHVAPEGTPFLRIQPGILPSRAADNLFWMGRYTERAESTLRVLRAYHGRLAETPDPDQPLLALVRPHLKAQGVDARQTMPDGLIAMVDSAVGSAGNIRDRFSPDGWLALVDLQNTLRDFSNRVQPGDDAARACTVLLRKLAGFAGLVQDNMYRFTGWRFLEIGRYLERALHMTRLAAELGGEDVTDAGLDLLLEIGDSVMAHRRRYPVAATRQTVVDLLVLDGQNPRSVVFQLARIEREVGMLPNALVNGQLSTLLRATRKTYVSLQVATPDAVTDEILAAAEREIAGFSGLLSRVYLN